MIYFLIIACTLVLSLFTTLIFNIVQLMEIANFVINNGHNINTE